MPPKSGTSAKRPRPSWTRSIPTDHSTLQMPEEPTKCRSGTPTQHGPNSSSSLMTTSWTCKAARPLKLDQAKMLKETTSKSPVRTATSARDGESSTLTPRRQNQRVDSIRSSVSIETDHSSLSPEWHPEESLKLQVEGSWLSRPRPARETLNSGTSITWPKQSSLNNGKTSHSISRMLEETKIFRLGQPTQDGSNSSTTMEATFEMKEERLSTFTVAQILKTDGLSCGDYTMVRTSNGTLCMLMLTLKLHWNQERHSPSLVKWIPRDFLLFRATISQLPLRTTVQNNSSSMTLKQNLSKHTQISIRSSLSRTKEEGEMFRLRTTGTNGSNTSPSAEATLSTKEDLC